MDSPAAANQLALIDCQEASVCLWGKMSVPVDDPRKETVEELVEL